MPNDGNILVVGTTTDYIEWIECRSRSTAVFLTAQRERSQSSGKHGTPQREILADLSDFGQCLQRINEFLNSTQTVISGIACFDDESLPLAAMLAKELGAPFPSAESIDQCLDKYRVKQVWRENGVPCPQAVTVTEQATEKTELDIFFPCVLKPHSGSGSERVFFCEDIEQLRQRAKQVIAPPGKKSEHSTAVAEEFIAGDEFSCDFVISDGNVQILRTARKVMSPESPLGTATAYILPSRLSSRLYSKKLPDILLCAMESLGISRAICMVDFMIRDDDIFLLEISPRIGGDCLPHVLFEAWGVDTIGLAMAFFAGVPMKPWLKESAPSVVGLRVFSPGPGKVRSLAIHHLADDPRIISHNLNDCIGRAVTMPPADYSSWMLGHVIFQPYASRDIEEQIRELRESIYIHLEEADT